MPPPPTPVLLTGDLARRLTHAADRPRWASTWVAAFASAALFAALLAGDPGTACSASDPCERWGAFEWSSLAALLLATPVLVVCPAVSIALAAYVALSAPATYDDPAAVPVWVWFAVAASLLLFVAVARRRSRTRGPARVLADAAAVVGAVPRTLRERGVETELPRLPWRAPAVAAGLVVAALLAGLWTVHVQGDRTAEEAAAPVVNGVVVGPADDYALVVRPVDGGPEAVVAVLEADDYAVGSVQPFWRLGPTDLRAVGEPYDAGYWYLLSAALLVGAAVVLVRGLERHLLLRRFLTRPHHDVLARGRLGGLAVAIYPLDGADEGGPPLAVELALDDEAEDPDAAQWAPPTEDEDEDEDEDDGSLAPVVELVLVGVPAAGSWCAPVVDGGPVQPSAPCARDPWAPGAEDDAPPDPGAFRVEDLNPVDVALEPQGREVHRHPRHEAALSVGIALVVTAVGLGWVQWLLGWAHLPAAAVAALTGLLALEITWRGVLRPRLEWDEEGLVHVGSWGPTLRVPWHAVAEVDEDGANAVVVIVDGPAGTEPPPGQQVLGVVTPGRRLPRWWRRGWRSAPELRAALLLARRRSKADDEPVGVSGKVVSTPAPGRPWWIWGVWFAVSAATAAFGWSG